MSQGRILVIEDNDVTRQLMTSLLQADGYVTLEATDGQTGIEQLTVNAGKVDLILLDLQMKPLGGFAFMRKLESLRISVPVVIVTGEESSDVLYEATRLNVAMVANKPIDKDKLLRIVDKTIQADKKRKAHENAKPAS